MPIYEYECDKHKVFEMLAYDLRDRLCPECGAVAKRIMSLSHFKFKEGYPSFVDTIDDYQKRQADSGKVPTLPSFEQVK